MDKMRFVIALLVRKFAVSFYDGDASEKLFADLRVHVRE